MIGKVVSHYRIEEKLGGGGMGVVYKALDTRLNRPVALKFLPPALTGDDDARQRFMQEAQAASALDHPNICTIHEIDTTDEDQLFIAMAFYDGETLKKRIAHGALPIEEAVDVAAQVARGLVKAHAAGIVHRDIKPANLMITNDGFVKIVDFGIAKLMGQTGPTQTGTTLGTVSYMAPEQVNGENVDPQTDVWALGAVLYEMLTGRPPFEGDRAVVVMNAIVQQALTPPSTLRAEIRPDIEQVVTKALAKDRRARYASARDFLEDTAAGETVGMSTGMRHEASPTGAASWRRPAVLGPALALLMLGAAGAFWSSRGGDARVAREETLPRIQTLIEQDRYLEAYKLAEEAEAILGDDPVLAGLWPSMSRPGSLLTDPPGAQLSIRDYTDPDAPWKDLGTIPLEQTRLPIGFFALRIELAGFEPMLLMVQNPSRTLGSIPGVDPVTFPLAATDSRSGDMVAVPSLTVNRTVQGMITGNDPIAPIALGDFLIDTYETTNAEFKTFVDAGGYETTDYWTHEFASAQGTLTWDDAMGQFVDATGRPGPATWELGTYQDGAAGLPVTGVSWYEAAAYATFRGKALPTLYHWAFASGGTLASQIVATSNFDTGPVPVRESGGLGPFGTFGMAGNVREWCFNASGDDRWILGGAWNDPVYLFTYANVQSPFDRSPTNGLRLVEYGGGDGPSDESARSVELSHRDYYAETPATDEIFEVYREQFSYDRTDLDAVIEGTEESMPEWTRQTVSFRAAYGDERVTAYLYLPTTGSPPYQTVVYFPGSAAIAPISSEGAQRGAYDFLVRSGRAVIAPVYKGTYERNDGLTSTWANSTVRYAEYLVQWVQDLQRSVDYLESRDDIDLERLAYFGVSWGGRMGAIIPAVEARFTTAIIRLGGLASGRARPEVDQINYVSRVTIPVLMLNGRFDAIEPLETSQLPMFELLGTPEADKRHVIFETDHFIPRNAGIREMLDWLDAYLGPVN